MPLELVVSPLALFLGLSVRTIIDMLIRGGVSWCLDIPLNFTLRSPLHWPPLSYREYSIIHSYNDYKLYTGRLSV